MYLFFSEFVQKSNKTHSTYCDNYEDAYKIIYNNAIEVIDWRIAPGDRLDVTWRNVEAAVPRNNATSPIIGNFVTQLAQLKLFEQLHKHRDSVAYCVSDI